MKVIVTGATGFFGPGIVARLRAAGHEVVPASRRSAEAPMDVTDAASCRALLAAHPGTDAVVHAAALAHVAPGPEAADRCVRVNVEGTRHIAAAAAAADVRRFIYISSVMVYGDFDLPERVTEETPLRASGMYGLAKRQAEAIVEGFAGRMQIHRLRMSTMYAPDWLYNVRKRVSPPVIGRYVYFTLDPEGRRYTLCSRRNGAEAVLRALDGRLPPDVYNVSDSHVYSQREILRAVEHVEGARPHLPVPVSLPRAAAALSGWLPSAALHDNARSRYWKFCEHNVYSSDKLAAQGLVLPPDLLEIGRPH